MKQIKEKIIEMLRDKIYGDKDRQRDYENSLRYKTDKILELFKKEQQKWIMDYYKRKRQDLKQKIKKS